MHTISNKKIAKEKITLVKYNDSNKASDLIEYMIKESKINFANDLPFLCKYIEKYILMD